MVSPLITEIIVLVSIFWFLVSGCYAQSSKYVRVAIVDNAASLSLRVNGHYEVFDSKDKKVLYQGKNLKTTVTSYKEAIILGAMKAKANKILIVTQRPEAITINGRRFKGNVELIKKDDRLLLAVNHIDLEDYIKGILYHESSHYWPMEALKAQAIACRSYALYQCAENKAKDFDVTSGIYSQVYGGLISERYRTNEAVEETNGVILVYQNKIIPAYFHSTCAGHTEDASLLWNINLAPLKGVSCGFCKNSPHFEWHYVLPIDEMSEKLTEAGKNLGKIKEIVTLGRDASGRITDFKIVTIRKETKVSAKDFRNIIGPNKIRSANFNVEIINSDALFEGFGWGHGVGLCQWGAYFMAKQDYTAEQILAYYYPGVKLETVRF